MAGKGKPKTGGRKKGTPNKATAHFKGIMDEILFDDPDETKNKLIGLRDSEEPQDRSIFWGLAKMRLPKIVEADVKAEAKVRVIDLTGGE